MPAPTHIAGSDSRPVFSVVSAIFRPWPSPPMTFSCRHEHVVEAGDAVLQAAQAEERVAPLDGDARRVALHHERGDAAPVPVGLRHLRHHDEQVGHRAVGGPQLHAVEPVVRRPRSASAVVRQPGRVGADVGLGEQERGDLAGGQPRQEPLLLLVGAEQLQRLRHADRLVRRQQRADRRVRRADERQRLAVVAGWTARGRRTSRRSSCRTRRARPGRGRPRRGCGRRARSARRRCARGVLARAWPGTPRPARRGSGLGPRPRVDQVQPEPAEEQFLAEARLAPLGLAGGLGDLPGLALQTFPALWSPAWPCVRLALRSIRSPPGEYGVPAAGYPRCPAVSSPFGSSLSRTHRVPGRHAPPRREQADAIVTTAATVLSMMKSTTQVHRADHRAQQERQPRKPCG